MTARDDLAVLFERRIIGEDPDDPDTRRYESALRQATSELDAIASLATNPETAPVVFAWLVETGVLEEGVGWLCPTSGLLLESPCSHDPVLLYALAREFGEPA